MLEGTWATTETTCKQQNDALTRAGFTGADLELAEWDAATCGDMMHGAQFTIRFAGDRLFAYQDSVIGWEGMFRAADASTFEAGDSDASLYLTFGYAIDGDVLTVDLIRDDYPAPAEERLGDEVALTVIFETLPFARLLSSSVLPYAIGLPDGWSASGDADAYESADGRISLAVGTGEPEPGQTVEDRVRINRESEFADCETDPRKDRSVTIGGEHGIQWTFVCGTEVGVAANTIHGGLGYRLTLVASDDSADGLKTLMAEFLAGFTFTD